MVLLIIFMYIRLDVNSSEIFSVSNNMVVKFIIILIISSNNLKLSKKWGKLVNILFIVIFFCLLCL